jgi:hypothetical protein
VAAPGSRGATWDEHRRQHERYCVLVTQAGHGVNQTPGDVADLENFLREGKVRKPSSDDLLAYPDLRSQPRMTPGRRHGQRHAGAVPDASTRPAAARMAWAHSTDAMTSALAVLSAAEKASILDELLAVRPALRELAETHATRLLSTEDRTAVADAVAGALLGLDIVELNGRAGYQPGRGYIHESEASDEILDEVLDPYLRDLERRAALGLTAAVELAVGLLLGLYKCRHGGDETLLEYSPDYAVEHAGHVVDQCMKLGIDLPHEELVDLMPEWDGVVD